MISSGPRNQMIWDSLLSPQDLFSFGIQLMRPRNCSRMVHLDRSLLKLNSHAQHLMKKVSALVEEQMEIFTAGIREESLVFLSRLMLANALPLLQLKVWLSQQVKTTSWLAIALPRGNSSMWDRSICSTLLIVHLWITWITRSWLGMTMEGSAHSISLDKTINFTTYLITMESAGASRLFQRWRLS